MKTEDLKYNEVDNNNFNFGSEELSKGLADLKGEK